MDLFNLSIHDVLDYITAFLRRHNRPDMLAEIARDLGVDLSEKPAAPATDTDGGNS